MEAAATRTTSGITFNVADVKFNTSYQPRKVDFRSFLEASKPVTENKGRVLFATSPSNPSATRIGHNGFVGAALDAYSNHIHLVLRPDDVWVQITTSLARYIDANAEAVRPDFVNHAGQIELVARGGGNIFSANYDALTDIIMEEMDKHTKPDVVPWMQCNFSTTTKKDRLVSKLVVMGAMKHYFKYRMELCCGLPKVTLEGTVEDWKDIRSRVTRLQDWGGGSLHEWGEVLEYVLDEFVQAAEGKPNTEFWNRIATITGGGSGPRYLEGWILAFIGFADRGRPILDKSLEEIKRTNSFGRLNINDIPEATVEVPVVIDDNGREYKTIFYAGAHVSCFDRETETVRPSLDWALIDVTA